MSVGRKCSHNHIHVQERKNHLSSNDKSVRKKSPQNTPVRSSPHTH